MPTSSGLALHEETELMKLLPVRQGDSSSNPPWTRALFVSVWMLVVLMSWYIQKVRRLSSVWDDLGRCIPSTAAAVLPHCQPWGVAGKVTAEWNRSMTELHQVIYFLACTIAVISVSFYQCCSMMNSMLWKGLIVLVFANSAESLTAEVEHRSIISVLNSSSMSYEDYSGLGLLEVPANISRSTVGLFLDYNNISSLADPFWDSQHAEHNCCTCFSSLPYLVFLDVSDNQLHDIASNCFSSLEVLSTVDLSNNKLQTIDKIFDNNRLLSWISFSKNSISYFHQKTFQNLFSLGELFLDNNLIQDIHQDSFRGLYYLNVLHLQVNIISKLDTDIFRDLGNLKYLNVGHNRLTYISEEIFQYLQNLIRLDASHNNILQISSTFFSHSNNLKVVDLSHNFIRHLSRFNFQDLGKLEHVNFGWNLLESLYLSRIPVSLTLFNDTNVLDINTEICTGNNENIPCFLSANKLNSTTIFHDMDFSFNRISKIRFSQGYATHTLELMRLSLEGNPTMVLPISLIKQEKFITFLNMSETNISWRNITLLNEILQLPNLKTLSISGCGACEYYMWQVVSSVFNPNHRIQIECKDIYTTHVTSSTNVSSLSEGSESIKQEDSLYTEFLEQQNISDYYNYFSLYPCHNFEIETVVNDSPHLQTYCPYAVDCSYVSLSTFPKIHSEVSCILLSHNDLTFLDPDHFIDLWNMQYLDVSHNRLSFLSGELFVNQNALACLKLDNNILVHLNSSTFKSLTNLVILTLHGNRISSYDSNILTNMQYLELLSIDFRNLTHFHDETFKNLSSLSILEMSEINMASYMHTLNDQHFTNLISLETCKIIGFQLNTSSIGNLFYSDVLYQVELENSLLPILTDDAFDKYKNIENIILIRNKIKHISKYAFRQLNTLLHLDLSGNRIKSLHKDLFVNTGQLIYLNISYNQISCIFSGTFKFLFVLEILDLSYNSIVFFNWQDSNNLLKITRLNLAGNSIGSTNFVSDFDDCFEQNRPFMFTKDVFPVCISNTPNVKELILDGNLITHLTNNTFTNTPFINYINLEHNAIKEIENQTFTSTPLLKALDLSTNALSVISKNLFKNLTLLELIDLSSNKLEFIEEGAFLSLKSLLYLHIESNRLKAFHFSLLSKENNLKALIVNNNYLTSLKITQFLPFLTTLITCNNELKNDIVDIFDYTPSLTILDISNTTLYELDSKLFQKINNLRIMNLANNRLAGLTCSHFVKLQELLVLNVTVERSDYKALDTCLGWKNLTLINCWFEMPNLDYLVLTGHPICNDLERTQIIENLFLSDIWKKVICSDHSYLPSVIISRLESSLLANTRIRHYLEPV